MQNCKPREQAFFTVMRQSGLLPHTIQQLKIKNLERILESETPIPCLIDVPQQEIPVFIGPEAVQYLKRYLHIRERREKLTPESLLFTARNNPNREINTKDVSRSFREAARKLGIGQKVKKGEPNEISLSSLTEFYRRKTNSYRKELRRNPLKDHEVLRSLYQENAMHPLEIEGKITISTHQFRQQQKQIKEMRQTIAEDNEYISSILSLLYDNNGDYETGENIELGNHFIELWKTTTEEQMQNWKECWTKRIKPLPPPYKDILEELTRTLERIMKPIEEWRKNALKKTTAKHQS